DVDHARRGAAAVVPLRLDAGPAVDGRGAGRRRPEHGPRGILHLDGPSPGDGDTEELAAGVADVDDVERGQRAATVVDRHGAGGGRAYERQAHDRSDGAAADEAGAGDPGVDVRVRRGDGTAGAFRHDRGRGGVLGDDVRGVQGGAGRF